MAIIHTLLGKLRGKLANQSFYVNRAGKNILRACPGKRRPGTKEQQRWEAEFTALREAGIWLEEALLLGFPEGRRQPAGERGFLRANAKRAAEVAAVDPARRFVRKAGVPRYFKAVLDYTRLLVADGTLATPEVRVEAEAAREGVKAGEKAYVVRFAHRGRLRERYECFLDDRVYGVIFVDAEVHCQVVELGRRGETWEREVRTRGMKAGQRAYAYVFATTAEGRGASPSVCTELSAEDFAADEEQG